MDTATNTVRCRECGVKHYVKKSDGTFGRHKEFNGFSYLPIKQCKGVGQRPEDQFRVGDVIIWMESIEKRTGGFLFLQHAAVRDGLDEWSVTGTDATYSDEEIIERDGELVKRGERW